MKYVWERNNHYDYEYNNPKNNNINNIDYKYNHICAHGEGGTFGPEREHRAVLLMSAFGAPHPDPKY